MTPFNWTCPHCGKPTTITEPNIDTATIPFDLLNERKIGLRYRAIICPGPACGKLTLAVSFGDGGYPKYGQHIWIMQKSKRNWRLIPESEAKPQPEYRLEPIREDYYEACRIRDLSPKASATLARRCLQGMIRDFWGVSKPTLYKEIDALKDKVDLATWGGIDAVRRVGNYGAHMQEDINVIVDVEPGEAQALIGLIEFLFEQWYVRREEDKQRLAELQALADRKDGIKQAAKAAKAAGAQAQSTATNKAGP